MKVLVTGAGGFVGKHLCSLLSSNGHNVLGLDHSNTLDVPNIEKVIIDITDNEKINKVFSDFMPEVVYHLAGIAFVPTCEQNFKLALDVNVLGTYNLTKASELSNAKSRFIFISTANVYGIVTPDEMPLTESSEIRINNNYALTKLMGEDIINKYQNVNDIDCVIFRAFNHIGPGQAKEFVIPSFAFQISEIAKGKKEATLDVGNLEAIRDFTDVRDIVNAYFLAINKGKGVYNLCSNNEISIQTIVDKLILLSGQGIKIRIDESRLRANDIPVLRGNNNKAQKDLNWHPKINLEDSLKDIYNQFL